MGKLTFYGAITQVIRTLLHILLEPILSILYMPATAKALPPTTVTSTVSASLSSSPSPSPATTTTVTVTTKTPPRPIPNSYWATPHLIACEYPYNPNTPTCPQILSLLLSGVRTFVDLTEAGELVPYAPLLSSCAAALGIAPSSIQYHRFPIRDRTTPPSASFLAPIMDLLRENEAQGRVVAVHCRGGIGRTGTVICCWLVESGRVRDGREALEVVAREWRGVAKCVRYPNSPETGAQCEFVRNWKGVGSRGRGVACV